MKEIATSDLVKLADKSVVLAMTRIFSSEVYNLDLADELKQLLSENKYDDTTMKKQMMNLISGH